MARTPPAPNRVSTEETMHQRDKHKNKAKPATDMNTLLSKGESWERSQNGVDTPTSSAVHIVTSVVPSLGSLALLAPEIRNEIYYCLLSSSTSLHPVPSAETENRFKLCNRTTRAQHEMLATLQNLGFVNRQLRNEARTYFYAMNRLPILCDEYEYLPVFVQWLEVQHTRRLHELLRECRSARDVIGLNLRHLCEQCLPELESYLNYSGPEPHDQVMPEVDVKEWARTIVGMEKVKVFEMNLALSADREKIRLGKERSVREFSDERGHVLAGYIEKRLRNVVRGLCERSIALRVRYQGGHDQTYYVPGSGTVRRDWPVPRAD
ncbi:hypothetical protein BDW02DRAFT_627451 [Decorospora gaudefroyi]|uniref:Uncharacterized protein n=1 Tax=Decorospora gaudefroyi TaxID=184978 RepID=A0A6A5KRI8_9PLEO|nr:hypothetical protein BDW02DRAFT_627451 [Decorospora gaudefroyi]